MQLPLPAEVLVLSGVGAAVAIVACVVLVIGLRRRRGAGPAALTDAEGTSKRPAEPSTSAPMPTTPRSRTVADAIAAREAATDKFSAVRPGRSGVGEGERGTAADPRAASDDAEPAAGATAARPDPGSRSVAASVGQTEAKPRPRPTETPDRFTDVDELEPDVAVVDLPPTHNASGLDWLASAGFTRAHPRVTEPDRRAAPTKRLTDPRPTSDGAHPTSGSGTRNPTATGNGWLTDRGTSAAADPADPAIIRTAADGAPGTSLIGRAAEGGTRQAQGPANPPVTDEAGSDPERPPRSGNETGAPRRPADNPASVHLPAPDEARVERIVPLGASGSPATWRGVERRRSSNGSGVGVPAGLRGAGDAARESAGRAAPVRLRPGADDRSAGPRQTADPTGAASPSAPDRPTESTGTGRAAAPEPLRPPDGWPGADRWFVAPTGGPRESSRPPRHSDDDPDPRHAEQASRTVVGPRATPEPSSPEASPGPAPAADPTGTRPATPSTSPTGAPAADPIAADRPRPHAAPPPETPAAASASAAGASRTLAVAVTNAFAARAAAPGADRRDDARDRLLAVLLDDPQHAVGAAVELQLCQERIGRVADVGQDERGRLGNVLNRLARAGLRTDQLARLSGLPADAVTDLLQPHVPG